MVIIFKHIIHNIIKAAISHKFSPHAIVQNVGIHAIISLRFHTAIKNTHKTQHNIIQVHCRECPKSEFQLDTFYLGNWLCQVLHPRVDFPKYDRDKAY